MLSIPVYWLLISLEYVVSFVQRHADCVPLDKRPQFETECFNVFAEEFQFKKQGSTMVGFIEDFLIDFAARKPKWQTVTVGTVWRRKNAQI